MKTCASMFSGGGGWDIAAMAAGYAPIWAIECEAPIADCYEANLGNHVIRDFVQCVDPAGLVRPDLLCASPVCKSFSVANADGKESDLDILCAHTVARFLRVLEPPQFCMENVQAYSRSKSMDIIREALQDVYGWWEEAVFNAAEFGVPQSRRRFIVRANGGFVAPPKEARRVVGWYEAIQDLVPTLPESQFAPWQLDRLPYAMMDFMLGQGERSEAITASLPSQTITGNHNQAGVRAFLIDGQNAGRPITVREEGETRFTLAALDKCTLRALLVEGDAAGERCPTVLLPSEPAFTLKAAGGGRVHRAFLVDGKPASYDGNLCVKDACEAVPTVTASQEKHPFRAWLQEGRVVAMTTRALARFQSFPDWYQFPQKKNLACTIIGNAVAPLFGQAMIESLN